jgi:adenine phosphoribosyltransferase
MAVNLEEYIASIRDFPTKGILFRDVTPLVQDGTAFHQAVDEIAAYGKKVGAEVVVGPESRGFIFGAPVAYALNIGFVPIRKPGKLPRETVSVKYDLEYGSNELFMHKDAIKKGQKVLIVDDLLATGGTAVAAAKMVEMLGGEVAGIAFVINLTGIPQEEALKKYDIFKLMDLSDQ